MSDDQLARAAYWVEPKDWESRPGYEEARACWIAQNGYPADFPVSFQCEYREIEKVRSLLVAVRADERERCAMVADDHDCTTYKEACPCTSLIAQRIREGTPA